MFKISFILVCLGVSLTMGLPPPGPNAAEIFARTMVVGGGQFLCAANSCVKDAIEKINYVACEYGKGVQNLADTSLNGFTIMTEESNARSVAMEPKCIDPTYTCSPRCDAEVPEIIIQAGKSATRVGLVLDCAKDLSEKDLKRVEEIVHEYHASVHYLEVGNGIQCATVMKKELDIISDKLESVCEGYKTHKGE